MREEPRPADAPRICCLDLDTFFVSVERLLDPTLIGKPVVVGATPGNRGVVTAASYEVREFGVRSGMPIAEAVRLAPHAVFLPTRGGTYSGYATRVRELLERFCPVVQVASIDEFYLDLRGCERLFRQPGDANDDATIERRAREITAAIASEIGLPASVGIATSRAVCKIASGLAKPAGVLLVPRGAERAFLAPLSVRKFPGIGPVAERKLASIGVRTLGDIAGFPVESLATVFGPWAHRIKRGAVGIASADFGRDRPAFREHDPDGGIVGSISNERTFREDVGDPASIEAQLCGLGERVCWRARKRGVKARTVTLKLRYSDFHTITRSRTIAPTHSDIEVYAVLQELYEAARTRSLPIRLLGVALSNLGFFDEQLELPLPDAESRVRLHAAVDTIRAKYGYSAVRRAASKVRD